MNEFGYKNRATMMPVVSAAGGTGPLLVVLKGNRLPYRTVLRNGMKVQETPSVNLPRDTVVATRADHGGFDSINFYSWAQKFVEYVRDLTANGRKVLLVYDAYRAHKSLEVLELFYESSIIVYSLPAYTSGKTQPLDTVVFSAFKSHLNRISTEVTMNNCDTTIDLFSFMSMILEAYYSAFSRDVIKAGSRRSGLWPIAPDRFLGAPRPPTAAVNTILSVEELELQFQERFAEYKDKLLGFDARLLNCGYDDTTNGFMMTPGTVTDMARSKRAVDIEKRAQELQEQLKRTRAADERLQVHLQAAKQFNAERSRVRAILCGTSVELFKERQRPMSLMQAIARHRAAARRQTLS